MKPNPRLLRWIARGYFWLAERLYNELAWFYDPASWIVSLGKWDSWRKCAFDFLVGIDMLEVGFGTGELLLEMARRGIHVCGLDPSPSMHRITRNKLRRQGLDIPRIQGITQQMPFADDSFDTILSTFPAGYIFEPETWREVARLLRKPKATSQTSGGRFVLIGLYITYTGKLRLPDTQPLFEQSFNDILTRINQLAQSVHLSSQLVIRNFVFHDLPIIIAERRSVQYDGNSCVVWSFPMFVMHQSVELISGIRALLPLKKIDEM